MPIVMTGQHIRYLELNITLIIIILSWGYFNFGNEFSGGWNTARLPI